MAFVSPFGLFSELLGQSDQLRGIFDPIEEALWNGRESYLRADEGSGEDGAPGSDRRH